MSLTPQQELVRTRIELCIRTLTTTDSTTFLGMVLLGLELEESQNCKLFETNGKVLRYNPETLADCPDPSLGWMLLHEAAHVAGLHHVRMREAQRPQLLNVAADLAINSTLPIAIASYRRPAFVLLPSDFDLPPGLSMEEYYALLRSQDEQEQEQEQDDQSTSSPDETDDTSSESESVQSQSGDKPRPKPMPADVAPAPPDVSAETEQTRLETLASAATNTGGDPGTSQLFAPQTLQNMSEPPLPEWARILNRFANTKMRGGTSWMRPNRRYAAIGMRMKGRIKKRKLRHLTVAIDVSSSVPRDVSQYALLQSWRIAKANGLLLRVILFNAGIVSVEEYDARQTATPDLVFMHGGGTRIQPVWGWLREMAGGIAEQLVVLVSDCEIRDWYPAPPQNVTVLVVTTRSAQMAPEYSIVIKDNYNIEEQR